MASTWRVLASVASSEVPTGVSNLSEVSEKSALGTNSVPSSRTMNTLATKMPSARNTVDFLWTSAQRKMLW